MNWTRKRVLGESTTNYLDNFQQIDILGVEDRLYIPKKTDPELILSIDGAAVPSPVTELDFPTEPSIEDKLRMLESTTINHDYHVMVYNKAYKGYYKSYKFPRPLKLRFKYTTPSLKYVLSPFIPLPFS